MIYHVTWIFVLKCLMTQVTAVAIDNGVSSVQLKCFDQSMELTINSIRPTQFPGRIYVKGRSSDRACSRALNLRSTDHIFALQHGMCGMERSGIVGQSIGVSYSVIVVVSFHPYFLTKVDRAYRLSCVYGSTPSETVTNSFEVSMIPTTDLQHSAGMPTCQYTIHKETENGAILRYANIGTKVAHVWRCEALGARQFMWVHDCYVYSQGQRNGLRIVDENGCAMDPVVLSHPVYKSTSLVVATHHAYKYADLSSLYFHCQISICSADQPSCGITRPPPVCPNNIESGLSIDPSPATQKPGELIGSGGVNPAIINMTKSGSAGDLQTTDSIGFAGPPSVIGGDAMNFVISDSMIKNGQRRYGRQRRRVTVGQRKTLPRNGTMAPLVIDTTSGTLNVFEFLPDEPITAEEGLKLFIQSSDRTFEQVQDQSKVCIDNMGIIVGIAVVAIFIVGVLSLFAFLFHRQKLLAGKL